MSINATIAERKEKEIEQAVQEATKKESSKKVRKDIQQKVDRYIELHKYASALEARLKTLRKEIEPYMDEKHLDCIPGTECGSINITVQNRSIVNARYTTYTPEDVERLVPKEYLDTCLTTVADRIAVDYLIDTGIISKDITKFKQTKPTKSFGVKRG